MLRLARESAARPEGTPSAEDVLKELRKAGVELEEAQQQLGSPMGARYCASSRSRDLRLTVCEYDSEANARAGTSQGPTPAPGAERRVLRNKKTLLWVLQPQPTEESKTQAGRATTAFSAL
ncbi:MAG: hypothetical protein M3Y59_21775 [Myxococcota bacterium]|nr:hypothetical protein [Myxococcota bacterium]